MKVKKEKEAVNYEEPIKIETDFNETLKALLNTKLVKKGEK